MTNATIVAFFALTARMMILPVAYMKKAKNLRNVLYYVWIVTWLLMVGVVANNLV